MKKLLFVCTGNTCRSPMAAAMWRAMGGMASSAGLFLLALLYTLNTNRLIKED